MKVTKQICPDALSAKNWLQQHDEEAEKKPSADDWTDYSAFELARYPYLRPKDVRGEEKREFTEVLARWERHIRDNPEGRSALAGLNSEQRRQLAALFVDAVQAIAAYEGCRQLKKEANELRAQWQRLWKTVRKLDKPLALFGTLLVFGRRAIDGDRISARARECLEALESLVDEAASLARFKPPDGRCESPVADMMVKLYWFFRHGCSLSGDESEVRTALIRNAFWVGYGVKPVQYRAKNEAARPKGCQAVHEAVRRFSRNQGTSHLKSSD